MRSTFCAPTVFTLLLLWSITAFTAPTVTDEFKVTEVFLKADDGRPAGPCPLQVTFRGYITANSPGAIKYTFTRSDGATGPVYMMEFKQAGTLPVMTDWTLGDAKALPRYAGWQAVKVLSPVEIESNHETGSFEINCGGGGPAPDKDFVDPARITAAYKAALPAIADAQLLLFRTKLEKLKSLNDELELKLDRGPKSANFNKQQLQDEFKSMLKEKDQKKLDQRLGEIRDRYEQQLTEQLRASGVDVAAERQRMASLLGFTLQEISQAAVLNAGRMLAVGSVTEFVDDRPPVEAAPEFYTDVFGGPFTGAGTRGSGSANHRDGTLAVAISSGGDLEIYPNSSHALAFTTQYVEARRGARRLSVSVNINELDLNMTSSGFFGSSSAEAAITLRVLEDGRVVKSRRVSLQRLVTLYVGQARVNRRLPAATLECTFDRAHPNLGNYLLVVELEGLVGSAGFAYANIQLSGRVGPFTVRTY